MQRVLKKKDIFNLTFDQVFEFILHQQLAIDVILELVSEKSWQNI